MDSGEYNYGSNCELILAAKSGSEPPSEEAYKAFYDIMIAYRYPMRYSEENQKKIEALSPEEKKLLEEDELLFIKKKFNELYPDFSNTYQVVTIPKSLYQLHGYAEKLNQDVNDSFKRAEDEEFGRPQTQTREQIRENALKRRIVFTNDPNPKKDAPNFLEQEKIREFHFRMNNSLIEKNAKGNDKFFDTTEALNQLVDDLCAQILSIEKKKSSFYDPIDRMGSVRLALYKYILNDEEGFKNFTKDLILNEWNSRKKQNEHFVYQGMGVDINKRDNRYDLIGNSYSYGDGVFSGGYNDSLTAMPFTYMKGAKDAYNFSITSVFKKLQDSQDDIIYVPRVTNLMSMIGEGEYHHARSRVARDYDFKEHMGFQQGEPPEPLKDIFLSKIKTNKEMEKAVIDYQKMYSRELISTDYSVDYKIKIVDSIRFASIDKKEIGVSINSNGTLEYYFYHPHQGTKKGTFEMSLPSKITPEVEKEILKKMVSLGIISAFSLQEEKENVTKKKEAFKSVNAQIVAGVPILKSSPVTFEDLERRHENRLQESNKEYDSKVSKVYEAFLKVNKQKMVDYQTRPFHELNIAQLKRELTTLKNHDALKSYFIDAAIVLTEEKLQEYIKSFDKNKDIRADIENLEKIISNMSIKEEATKFNKEVDDLSNVADIKDKWAAIQQKHNSDPHKKNNHHLMQDIDKKVENISKHQVLVDNIVQKNKFQDAYDNKKTKSWSNVTLFSHHVFKDSKRKGQILLLDKLSQDIRNGSEPPVVKAQMLKFLIETALELPDIKNAEKSRLKSVLEENLKGLENVKPDVDNAAKAKVTKLLSEAKKHEGKNSKMGEQIDPLLKKLSTNKPNLKGSLK